MKRRGRAIDGLLLLNKPPGMTSNRALQEVRRLLDANKGGHTGSLDPAATGMLPLCFGEATKVCAYLLDADKRYRVTARLGTTTDTGDADGKAVAEAAVPRLTAEQWDQVLQSFVGETQQVPPMYSALKKDGKRLYELARKGETVEREARTVRIDDIVLLEATSNRLVFRVACSKGTYIRVLVEDIARKAGTLAHTARLHRESVGDFEAQHMLDLDTVRRLADSGELDAKLMPADQALGRFAAVSLSADDAGRFRSGQLVDAGSQAGTGLVRVYGPAACFIGIGELANGSGLAPRRVFNPPENTR